MSISIELICDTCNSDEVYFMWMGNKIYAHGWYQCRECGEKDYEQTIKYPVKRWWSRER